MTAGEVPSRCAKQKETSGREGAARSKVAQVMLTLQRCRQAEEEARQCGIDSRRHRVAEAVKAAVVAETVQ